MNKEFIIVILAPIIIFSFMWYRDKRRKQQELSDRLNNTVVNLNNERGRK